MKFTMPRFAFALVVTLIAGAVIIGGLKSFGILQPRLRPGDPAALVREATAALEAVRTRTPGELRQPGYDAVLAPLDKILTQTKTVLEGENYDPVGDYETVRSLALPVIDIATQADAQARTETGFLTKEYRFNAQKGEAIQYLANAMWERILRRLPPQTGFFNEGTPYPPHEMQELRRLLDTGIEAAPENAQLYYIRGVINRAEGVYGPASRDLEKAVSLDADFAAAWNVLGLVRIHLREFVKAEEALERARQVELLLAERTRQPVGNEYVAVIYNLASFHDNLAAYYNREYRMNPTVESQRLLARHSAEARRYYEEFLQHEPSGSQDAATVRSKLQALPR